MPCNTAHWFYDELCRHTDLPVLHMLRLTADSLEREGIGTVGLLATDGTIRTGIYETLLADPGYKGRQARCRGAASGHVRHL